MYITFSRRWFSGHARAWVIRELRIARAERLLLQRDREQFELMRAEFEEQFANRDSRIKHATESATLIVPKKYIGSDAEAEIKKISQHGVEYALFLLATLCYKRLVSNDEDVKPDGTGRTWFPLHSGYLEAAHGKYLKIVRILEKYGFIERDHSYLVNIESKKYRLGPACYPTLANNPDYPREYTEWLSKKLAFEAEHAQWNKDQRSLQAGFKKHRFDKVIKRSIGKSPAKRFKEEQPCPYITIASDEKFHCEVRVCHENILRAINESREHKNEIKGIHTKLEFLLNARSKYDEKYVSIEPAMMDEARRDLNCALVGAVSLPEPERSKVIAEAQHKYSQAEYVFIAVNNRSYYTIDDIGRAHHACTAIPRKYKKHLRILGRKCHETDFKNSQPAVKAYTMLEMISPECTPEKDQENIKNLYELSQIGNTRPIIGYEYQKRRNSYLIPRFRNHNELLTEIAKAYYNLKETLLKHKDELQRYADTCFTGKAYECFAKAMDEALYPDGSKTPFQDMLKDDKSKFKGDYIFLMYFSHPEQCNKECNAAKQAFPDVFAAIDKFKDACDYGLSAKWAQRVEAKEMYESVATRTSETNPFIIIRHDSIITINTEAATTSTIAYMTSAFKSNLVVDSGPISEATTQQDISEYADHNLCVSNDAAEAIGLPIASTATLPVPTIYVGRWSKQKLMLAINAIASIASVMIMGGFCLDYWPRP